MKTSRARPPIRPATAISRHKAQEEGMPQKRQDQEASHTEAQGAHPEEAAPVYLSIAALRQDLSDQLRDLGVTNPAETRAERIAPAPQYRAAHAAYQRQKEAGDAVQRQHILLEAPDIVEPDPRIRSLKMGLWLVELLDRNGVEEIKLKDGETSLEAVHRDIRLHGLLRRMDGTPVELPLPPKLKS